MKPTFSINHTSRPCDTLAARRTGSATPKIEYFFQPPAPEFSGHRRGDSASFRAISEQYFAREAGRHFKTEALFFCLMAAIAAVPVVEGIRGLAQFVYGVL